MREWFIVGAKLMGVYFLYSVLSLIVGSTGLIASIAHSRESIMGSTTADIFLTTCFTFIASLGFAYMLLFQTEWLTDRFKLVDRPQAQATPSSPVSGKLQMGIILIGIYIFCTHIGSLAHAVLTNLAENNMYTAFAATQPKGITFSLIFISPVLTLLFSLFLIFGSGKIAAFLEKRTMTEAAQDQTRV
jgi:hypothetical protein